MRKQSGFTFGSDSRESEAVHLFENEHDISKRLIEECPDLKFLASTSLAPADVIGRLDDNRIEQEFRILGKITNSNIHAEKIVDFTPEMNALNRYQNIFPFAFNIVRLEDPFDYGCEEYINASYISSTDERVKNKYIATQAPLHKTFNTFWKMIWKEDVRSIFCITRLFERTKILADKYWPTHTNAETTEDFTISVLKKIDLGFSIQTVLQVSHNQSKEKKQVTHYQLLEWDDGCIPSDCSIKKVVDLCLKANLHHRESKTPIVVHCSAGVGRTGTFIAICEACEQLDRILTKQRDVRLEDFSEQFQAASVFEIVRRLREQRWGAVKTFEQYKFIYQSLQFMLKQRFAAPADRPAPPVCDEKYVSGPLIT